MSQYFVFINIDKRHRIYIGEFGESYLGLGLARYFGDPDVQYSWAGDRLILLGNNARDFPAGIEEDGDTKDMFTYIGPESPPPPRDYGPSLYTKTSVLRNLCTREYIQAELFPPCTNTPEDHPTFGDVILPKIVWTSDPSMAMPTEIDPRGPWAGGRFDVVELDTVKNDSEWNDITEIEFFNFYTMWSADVKVVKNCACTLCEKYRNEHEAFYNKTHKRAKPPQLEGPHETAPEHMYTEPEHGPNPVYSSISSNLSAIELLPAELQGEIMVHLSTGDLAACAATSKTFSFQANRRLYLSVRLEYADQTKILLETISRQPGLARYIKDLRLVTIAHWQSLQIAHDILKQLPALKSLEFAPCWLSYGSLLPQEYPFTLQSLTWGLKRDSAFDQFCRSQVDVHVTLQDPNVGMFMMMWTMTSRCWSTSGIRALV